ncbi:hypothetical protein METBIDRAFT_45339 [Metschnikowia bicuspidata var. bicuspidata NRRL YB-4993]|uniref:Receptor/non-receptor type protein-tyrosine phosphatase n=1 Tax=Metschnikowia bicuspidata var. bicuspidata NRRL YB-4993 TaxID=869754 RepID=A0A1A0H794_9ASCO|nr:hypothetical protein METBIDRAFT_45339 [Metschnikowia bicuspidata var. bicuspidata NRRL YB-4993]OBA19896.1 hypothetical protein METBIDRAFT_45339 [Metschnikowia bicuspidata var. bicuspidata NRRL YB-4993]
MIVKPRFLNISELEQRAGFRKISAYCDSHLSEALEPSSRSQWNVNAAFDPVNRNRNRYSNVLPWDKTRVSLSPTLGGSDYINASYVQLAGSKYIAAQGPLRNTVHHFWAMCFAQAQESGSLSIFIAMVTPLVELNREKCFQYWPTREEGAWDMGKMLDSDRLAPNDLRLSWVSEKVTDLFVLTRFRLQSGDVSKTVYHYYYLGWRDTLTPNSMQPLLLLSAEISALKQTDPNLVPVVHCSAGVGRTGTFIAIDHFIRADLAKDPETDIVFETVKTLRDHRMMMVQTVQQYLFLYQAAKRIHSIKQT